MFENLIKPLSSMYLTIKPISSIWEASITLGAFFSPFLVAIRFPILSVSIVSATSFNSRVIISAIFSSLPDTPGAKDSSLINSILSPNYFLNLILLNSFYTYII